MSSSLTEINLNKINELQELLLSELANVISPTIDLKIDPNAVTYFQDPICRNASYYSSINVSSAEKLAESIKELWMQSGKKMNQEICLKISNLAMDLKSDLNSQSPELSEFIYTLH